MKKYLLIVGLLLSSVANAQCVGDESAKPARSVYVVPQLATTQLYSHWIPVLEKVGKETKQCLELHVPSSIPEFESAVLSGQADYAYMNPYHEVMAHKAQGYEPLVADGNMLLQGIIVVRSDSPIKNIRELSSKQLAFPAPNAFAASLLVRSELTNNKIPFTPVYVKSHSNVYRSVIIGDYAAGGGINYTLDREPRAVQDKLRILWRSPKYSSHPFSAHPRIPKETQMAVTQAFINLSKNPENKKMLEAIQMIQPHAVTYSNNYAVLESLNLERFVVRDSN